MLSVNGEYEDSEGSEEEKTCTQMRYNLLGHLCDKLGQSKSMCPKKAKWLDTAWPNAKHSNCLDNDRYEVEVLNVQIFKTSLIFGDCESAKPLKITKIVRGIIFVIMSCQRQ